VLCQLFLSLALGPRELFRTFNFASASLLIRPPPLWLSSRGGVGCNVGLKGRVECHSSISLGRCDFQMISVSRIVFSFSLEKCLFSVLSMRRYTRHRRVSSPRILLFFPPLTCMSDFLGVFGDPSPPFSPIFSHHQTLLGPLWESHLSVSITSN